MLSFGSQPFVRLLCEEPMRENHARSTQGQFVIVDRRGSRHHGVEGLAISVRRPHLEPVLRTLPEGFRVRYERFQSRGLLYCTDSVEFGMESIEQQLELS